MKKVPFSHAFQVIGHVYDLLMEDVPYEQWVNYLREIFRRMNHTPTRVLDLGCGTGNPTLYLSRHVPVTGLDASRNMLDIASEKLHPRVPLIQGDFRFLPFRPASFSTVFSMLDSLNNLLTEKDLQQTFDEVFRVLEPGGLFTFDVNTPWVLEHFWGNDEKVKEVDGMVSIWRTEYSSRNRRARLWITVFVPTDTPGVYQRLDEVHVERGWDRSELDHLLRRSGFLSPLFLYHLTFRPADEATPRLQVVTRKPS